MKQIAALLALGAFAGLSACASSPQGPVNEAGDLAAGDDPLETGEYSDEYSFSAKEGQWVKIELRSTAFDPYLILRVPDSTQYDNDDMPEGDSRRSEILAQIGASGQYQILVTSFDVGETGPYSLTYEVTDAKPEGDVTPIADPDAAPDGPPPVTASPGDSVAVTSDDDVQI